MTRTPVEPADRVEIEQLLATYSAAIDGADLALLDDVFTDDAVIDYTSSTGPRGSLDEVRAFLAAVLPAFAVRQHQVLTSVVTATGPGTAAGSAYCRNPMVLPDGRVLTYGVRYDDTYRRTPAGWRIAERVENALWGADLPPGFPVPGAG